PDKKICTSVIAYKFILAYLTLEYYEQKNNTSLFPNFEREFYKEVNYEDLILENPNILEVSKEYLGLAAVGTITDLMPLLGENRIIVWNGCKVIQEIFTNPSRNFGLYSLLKSLNLNPNKILSKDLGWGIGPVLNAAGRMGRSETAIQLLLSYTQEEADKYCEEILQLNKERKERTKRNIFRVEQYFARNKAREERDIIFCYEPDLEPGVSGIVATKLVEIYRKPVVFITPENGKARGSVRSYGNENVVELLQKVADLLLHFGGHPEAGGFSIELTKIPILEERLIQIGKDWVPTSTQLVSKHSVFQIFPENLTEELYTEISIFEPFGHANPTPLISIQGAEVLQLRPMGDGTHARFSLLGASPNIKCVIWKRANELNSLVSKKSKIDLWGTLEENYFNGTTSLQFQVVHFA
ncbi:MAG: DHHA1 domain-containing protein, partial [Leptospiraceae bacterium]|nr:DHHA1 domain-containing protein [Leptospiraceae bacterium]